MDGNKRSNFALIGMCPLLMAAQPLQTTKPTVEIAATSVKLLSPRLREYTFRTSMLATTTIGMLPPNPSGETKVRVLLPDGYDSDDGRRYPVLYLYHGGTENQAAWTTPETKGKAEELTKGRPLIVVMPDGGMAGGYADWYNDGALGPPKWKSFHLSQLIPWVDAQFRTVANRTGRASAGLSMGGGGFRYAAQRPDLFGATASFSGDIDILQPASDWNGAGIVISRQIWGDRRNEEVRWRGANAVDLAKNLQNTSVAIFSGDSGRPEATYILSGARAAHDALDSFGIAHRYTIYPGMTHNWENWNRAFAAWLPDLQSYFDASNMAGNPSCFTYSTIDAEYSIYGWTIGVKRKALEFSALEVDGNRQFALVGSGTGLVVTPPLGAANSMYRASISDAQSDSPPKSLMIKADGDGRVRVSLNLGTANPFQQYSVKADSASTGPANVETPFRQLNNGSKFHRVTVTLSGPLKVNSE